MIKFLNNLSNKDINEVGGKAAGLGELIKAKIPVPEGFVITTNVSSNEIKDKQKEIYEAFDKLSCKFVSVRSSATKEDSTTDSFAGQFETYLNVKKENIIKSIIECINSINSPKIKAYCEEKKIDKSKIKMAVIIQKMVDSEVAGVSFTIHPVSKDKTKILIEAGLGLGEVVVSGMINPDDYIIDKETLRILNISIGDQEKMLIRKEDKTEEIHLDYSRALQQKLPTKFIIEIAKMSKKIEDYFKKPMDIEWAIEKDRIYFMQARPITTID